MNSALNFIGTHPDVSSANEHLRQLALCAPNLLFHFCDIGWVRVSIPLVHLHPQVVQSHLHVFTVLVRTSHAAKACDVDDNLVLFREFLLLSRKS